MDFWVEIRVCVLAEYGFSELMLAVFSVLDG
jgi:hypothetical protein